MILHRVEERLFSEHVSMAASGIAEKYPGWDALLKNNSFLDVIFSLVNSSICIQCFLELFLRTLINYNLCKLQFLVFKDTLFQGSFENF